MPLSSCDSKEFEKLHKDIGNKAAIKIQTYIRKHLKHNKTAIETQTNFRKYLRLNSPNGLYGKKTVTRPRSPGLRWGERN